MWTSMSMQYWNSITTGTSTEASTGACSGAQTKQSCSQRNRRDKATANRFYRYSKPTEMQISGYVENIA